jgi:flavin-dependent dehydrogenase
VNEILTSAGVPLLDVPASFRWHGTPLLTRRRALIARGRVFVAGDAAGYIEPFTGEGMGWAIASGIALAPLVIEKLHRAEFDAAGEWIQQHAYIVGRRQRVCAVLAAFLRRPRLTRCAVRVLGLFPLAGSPLVRSVERTVYRADPVL